jgi:hypothetical protein
VRVGHAAVILLDNSHVVRANARLDLRGRCPRPGSYLPQLGAILVGSEQPNQREAWRADDGVEGEGASRGLGRRPLDRLLNVATG